MTDPNQPDSPASASEPVADSPADEGTRRPRRRRAPKAEAGAGAMTSMGASEASMDVATPTPSPSQAMADGEGSSGKDAAGPGPRAEPGADEGEPRRKRHRNRRRNRRGGQRADEGRQDSDQAGEAADDGAGADAAAQAPPPANLPATDVNELFADVVSGLYDASAEVPAVDASPAATPAVPGREDGMALPEASAAASAVPALDSGSSVEALALPPGENGSAPAELPADANAAEAPAAAAAVPGDDRQGPARRVLAPDADAPKLQKVLAQSGVGSRRDLEQMIASGRIVVNGQPAHVGQRIRVGDRITLDGKPVRVRIAPATPRVLAYHKPVGEVVTHDDPQARPTVFRRLPRLPHGKWQSVGRLDINTEGLLLFTNSGDLANRLMHPRFGVEREYAVRVLGTLTEEEREQLLQGVPIEGQTAAFSSIADGGGEGVNHWYRVVITEGRNREVRKLFDSVHKAVSRLIRIRYGSVVLPRGLRRGVWVDLGADDLKALQEATGMPARGANAHRGEDRPRGPRGAKAPREGRGPGPQDERSGGKRGGRGRDRDRDGRRGEGSMQGPMQSQGQGQRRQQPVIPDFDDNESLDNIGPIPDPLQQTYDKRAFQQSRQRTREYGEDGPIPNPLQQTYDKRAIQGERRPQREFSEDGPIPNPLQQTYDKRFASSPKAGGGKPAGGGRGRRPPNNAPRKSASGGQPDPMRTAVGYIGGDAFHNKQRGGGRGGRGGPKPGGGSGGGGRGRSGGGSGGGGR